MNMNSSLAMRRYEAASYVARASIQCPPMAMMRAEQRSSQSTIKASKGVLLKRFAVHRRHVLGVAMSKTKLLTCSADGTCVIFSRATLKQLLCYTGHWDAVFGGAFIDPDDDRRVLTWSRDCSCQMWDSVTGATIRTYSHGQAVKSAVFDQSGYIFTHSNFKTLTVWDSSNGTVVTQIPDFLSLASTMAISLPYVCFGTFGSNLVVCDVAQVVSVRSKDDLVYKKFAGHSRAILTVAIDGARRLVLTGSEDKTSLLFDLLSGEIKQRFRGHTESILSCGFSPTDASLGVTSSADKSVRLWDLETGDCTLVFTCSDAVCSVVLSRGFCFAGCADNTAYVIDVSAGGFEALLTLCRGTSKSKESSMRALPVEVLRKVKQFIL